MKQLIVPIAIIVALIAFFVIIDRKEFSRHVDVQTVQSESSTTNRKSTGSVPETKPVTDVKTTAEAKPIETKPVVEIKPVAETMPVTESKPVTEAKPKTDAKSSETKPVAETKPAEVKPVAETKPRPEAKPVAQTKPRENLLPAAVPVVTAEEAEKLNAFAIFLSTVKTTVVEGEIIERSELPDPQKSDYPNCRFTAHFNGNSIKSGNPCPKEISLVVEGFANYTLLDTNKIVSGDKVECSIIPYESLTEEYKSTQQADDLNLFLLENYYVLDIKKINTFAENNVLMPRSGIFFSDGAEEYISIFERHLNSPIPQKIIEAQNESIQNDLKKMDLILKGYDEEKIKEINERFKAVWSEEKEKDPPGYNRVGSYVWRNDDNSFWCLPVNYSILTKPALLTQKTLDAFAALKEACEANGVQLIISLIPHYTDISSRVLNKEFQNVPDLQTATYVKQLSEIGVETIYSADTIIQNYNRYPFAFFYPTNAHPSDTAQDVNSDILVDRLKRYNIEPELDPTLFSVRQSPHVFRDQEAYLFPKDCDIGNNEAGTAYTCREILYDGKLIPRTSDAPIITLGNSYLQTPMSSPDTLPTLLSMKLLSPVDYLHVEASGPFTSIISQILATPERYLEHRKVLIMQYGTTALSNANANALMFNIREEDENRLLFNNKSIILSYDELTSVETDDSIDNSLWENLPQKHIQVIGESGILDIAKIAIDSQTDISKNIVCMIPAVCFKAQSASFLVNGIKKSIPTFYRNPFYSFITFELPPGTKTIEISAEGKKGTAIAIKDIQIWQ